VQHGLLDLLSYHHPTFRRRVWTEGKVAMAAEAPIPMYTNLKDLYDNLGTSLNHTYVLSPMFVFLLLIPFHAANAGIT
jgi:hypothetical protein